MISVENLSIEQGAFRLEEISFFVPSGAYAVFMGRTGSGKTTVLEAVCGLRKVLSGKVLIYEKDVTREKPATRNIGYVPQDAALFSMLTVRQNLTFALSLRRWTAEAMRARSEELARLLGVTKILDRPARQLSGGEAQRVALGRALAFFPPVLVLDEPLSALDDDTREEMIELLSEVHAQTRVTVFHVTHNRDDARKLATKVFCLQDGLVREEKDFISTRESKAGDGNTEQ